MATYDWNKDGKHDAQDEMYDYDIFVDVHGEEDFGKSHTKSGFMDNYITAICVVLGLIAAAFVVSLLGLENETLIVVIAVILWFILAAVIRMILSKLGF